MRVVFVHGAVVRDGAWWWRRTAEPLLAAGVPSVCPVLPSCGETGRAPGHDGPGLADDVAAVRAALTASDEPTVVVGHSYGGIVATEAAAGVAAVRHLVYVSSYLPEPGQALGDFGGEEPAPFLVVDAGVGTFAVDPAMFADTFMADCPDDVDGGLARLAPQSLAVVGTPVSTAAWREIPSTYVVCTRDRGTPADRQRGFAGRATDVVELDAGHHPFLARPQETADLLLALRRGGAAQPWNRPGAGR